MSRNSLKKKNSKILRLKILLEDKEVAEEELDIGSRELTQILKEYSSDVTASQKKKFDNLFFGTTVEEVSEGEQSSSSNTDIVLADNNIDEMIETSTNNEKLPEVLPWVKKLYRLIIQRSHPDKYIDFPILAIKEKYTRICMNAMIAMKTNDIGLLLLCAYEVEIDVDEPDAEAYITSSANSYKQTITAVTNLIGFQWYHLPDINRTHFLETYLAGLGFKFDEKKASKAIKNNKIKRRKSGTRPPKMRRNTL